jgi:hypothetical protein
MESRSRQDATTAALYRMGPVVAAGAALLLFFLAFMTAGAAGSPLSESDTKCLGCHSYEGLEKKLENGETLSLYVQGDAFAQSVHKTIGCAGCHADVDLKNHPGAPREVKSARQHSIERAGVCRQCHEDAFKQHEGSVHAVRLSEGSVVAPVCTGCHSAHSVTPKTAYETCVACHAGALDAHRKWLPNAARHHEVVSCAACHAPAALRMVDLRLYDRAAKAWVSEKEGPAQFEKLARSADVNGDGLDPVELRNLLREINGGGKAAGKTLRGRIELRADVEAHRLSEGSKAIKACDNCHQAGAEPFQKVTISVIGPDGRPVRYPAHKEVLTAALSVVSLPDFYAIGGTRSGLLDLLFVLALISGIAVPAGHMTLKWLFRKTRRPSPADRPGGDAPN